MEILIWCFSGSRDQSARLPSFQCEFSRLASTLFVLLFIFSCKYIYIHFWRSLVVSELFDRTAKSYPVANRFAPTNRLVIIERFVGISDAKCKFCIFYSYISYSCGSQSLFRTNFNLSIIANSVWISSPTKICWNVNAWFYIVKFVRGNVLCGKNIFFKRILCILISNLYTEWKGTLRLYYFM